MLSAFQIGADLLFDNAGGFLRVGSTLFQFVAIHHDQRRRIRTLIIIQYTLLDIRRRRHNRLFDAFRRKLLSVIADQ